VIEHSPPRAEPTAVDPARLERALSDWFGRHVVLMSSGRAGLQALLAIKGLGRYRDAMLLPRYLSRCVINAVTFNAMPVRDGDASATLLYHQYGYEQRFRPPSGVVIEDIAHAFFATADTGERQWRSDAAIFSLPKFFGTAGLGGGAIVESEALAGELRERVARATRPSNDTRAWMRSVVQGARAGGPEEEWLDAVYELLFRFLAPDADDLAGMPATRAGIAAVGAARAERVAELRAALPYDAWAPMGEAPVPYALPLFGAPDALARIDAALAAAGIHAGVYHLDVRRDMSQPEFRPCVLLPCHQGLAAEDVARIVASAAA
jgi:hypothetical protein